MRNIFLLSAILLGFGSFAQIKIAATLDASYLSGIGAYQSFYLNG